MAFQAVAGYNQFPNGNWSPVIYSKKAQIAFRRSAVVQAITNTDYFGEISEFGDTVNIIIEPDIQVNSYARGQQVTAQDLDDEQLVLVVDKANSFAFKVDDIEKKHSHIGWESLAANRAGYKLRDTMDSEVLTYMTTQAPAANVVGTTADPTNITTDILVTGDFSATALMNRIKRLMNANNVPEDDRWFVADPVFYEFLEGESSKLIDRDFADGNILRNGQVTKGLVRGFRLYNSNNLPIVGTGPTATTGANGGWILAGHMSSTATAEQINKVEDFRDPDSFADVVRGLHMYGRKVLRTEALYGAVYQTGTVS
jgi:hypothetical protein